MVWPEGDLHVGLPPGALQGDDVQLEYYEDGYPKLPACLIGGVTGTTCGGGMRRR